MMGIPGESVADFRETLQMVRRCEPDNIWLSIYYPYPGTDLYCLAKEQELFKKEIISHVLERKRPYLNLPGFSKRRIRIEYILFKFNVYKGKQPLKERIFYAMRAAI